jgi:hypothetical protein
LALVRDTEDFKVYVLRLEDRQAWLSKQREGDETARRCLWAASEWMSALASEHLACSCCDRVLSPDDKPRAFVILIPVEGDAEKIATKAGGVCAQCTDLDNEWIVAQAVPREDGLPLALPCNQSIH